MQKSLGTAVVIGAALAFFAPAASITAAALQLLRSREGPARLRQRPPGRYHTRRGTGNQT